MKILHTSDWHVGRSLKGRSRAGEHRAVLVEIARLARDHRVDLVLIAGDLFDSQAPSPDAEAIVYRALLDLAETAPVVIIAGNHDHPGRLEAVAPLLELGRVKVGSLPKRVAEGGRVVVETEAGPAVVALLPFLSQRFVIHAEELMTQTASAHSQDYAGRVGRIIEHLTDDMPGDVVTIAMAHLTTVDGKLDGSERLAHTVMDYAVSATLFPASLHYVALGHLHRLQKVRAGSPTWYSGSPLQLDFGEEADRKGVLLVDATPSTPASVRSLPLSSGRPMVTLRGSLDELEALASSAPDAHLRIVVDGEPGLGLFEQVREWFPDVVQVRITGSGPTPPTMLTEARVGRPPRELFAEYLAAHRARDDRILALFDELVEEAHAAASP